MSTSHEHSTVYDEDHEDIYYEDTITLDGRTIIIIEARLHNDKIIFFKLEHILT